MTAPFATYDSRRPSTHFDLEQIMEIVLRAERDRAAEPWPAIEGAPLRSRQDVLAHSLCRRVSFGGRM